MPKATDIKTQSGNGALYSTQSSQYTANANAADSSFSSRDVIGDNLGTGHGVFAGSNNSTRFVTMEFRSLTAGPGISISGDKDSILIESTGVLTTNLADMSGRLPVAKGGTGSNEFQYNSLLIGNGLNPVQEILPPVLPNQILLWTGSGYEWTNLPNSGGTSTGSVTSVAVVGGSNKLVFSGGPITSSGTITADLIETNIPINNLGGVLTVAKGGTGVSSFQANTVLLGNGTTSIGSTTPPSAPGQVLTWAGTGFNWTTPTAGINTFNAYGTGGINATSSVSNGVATLNLSLASTGISSGTYTNPTLTVDSYGRVISVTSNPIAAVNGQNLGVNGHVIYAGKVGDDLSFKRLEEGQGIALTSGLNSVSVSLGTVPLSKGGTGATSLTQGALTYVGSDKFYSIVAAPSGASSLLGYDGAGYRWFNVPGNTAVVSGTDDIAVTSSTSGSTVSYMITLKPENVSINEFGSILDTFKGGTGRSSFPVNSLLVGDGGAAINYLSAPTTPSTYLSWTGTGYEWKAVNAAASGITSLTAGNGLTTTANSNASGGVVSSIGTLHLANTGVVSGTYRLLSATVNATGQITSATDAESTVLNRANHLGQMPATAISGVVSAANGGTGLSSLTGNAGKYLAVDPSENSYSFVTPSAYVLPVASKTVLGGIKLGNSLSATADGTVDVAAVDYAKVTNKPELFSGFYSDLLGAPDAFSGEYADLANAPVLAPVATSGAYADLTGKPTLATVATSGNYVDLINKPTISRVAETGSYADLVDVPPMQPATTSTLGGVKVGAGLVATADGTLNITEEVLASGVTSVGVVSTTPHISVVSSPVTSSGTISVSFNESLVDITNTAGTLPAQRVGGLSNVATSGDYFDLINVPTPAPAYSDVEARLAISATGDLQYDATTGVIHFEAPAASFSGSYNDLRDTPELFSEADARNALSATGGISYDPITGVISPAEPLFSGAYEDLTGAPDVFSGNYEDLTNKPTLFSGAYQDLTGAPAQFSGSYSDLTDKPTLFSGAYGDLTDAPEQFSGSYSDLTDKPELFSGAYEDLTGTPVFAAVATSGSYNDLTNKPAIPSIAGLATTSYVDTTVAAAVFNSGGGFTGNYNDLVNTPVLAAVATSGDYADLTNTPELFSGDYEDLANKPTLFSGAYEDLTGAPAQFSGSYNDLTDKPVIPAAYTDAQARASISAAGDLQYDALTGTISYTAPEAFSGNYQDLNGTPDLFSGNYEDLENKPTLFSGAYEDLTGAPAQFSGSYNDLTDKPEIFSGNYEDLVGIPTNTGFSGDYEDLTNKPTLFSGAYEDLTGTPAQFSGSYQDLTGAPVLAPVATSGSYNDLTSKPVIPAAYTDAQARASISAAAGTGLSYNPTTGVLSFSGAAPFSGSYNDLTDKPTIPSIAGLASESWVTTQLSGITTGDSFSGNYSDLVGAPALALVATTGSYADLTNKPTIPSIAGLASEAWVTTQLSGITTGDSFSGSYTDLTDKPTLFSGAYQDLTGKPTLFSGNYEDLVGIPTNTGFSGDYEDLTNKPTIPAAYTDSNARSAISLVAGTSGATYTAATGVLNLSALVTGEANTLESVGTGTSLVKGKVGTALQVKSLVAGSNISLSEVDDTIVISSTASAGGTGGAATPVQSEGAVVAATPTAVNFTGAGVTVTDVDGVATVDIPGVESLGIPASAEYVELAYTAGTNGTFLGTPLKSKSDNVEFEVLDGEQCQVRVTITGRATVPSSIWVYGYNVNQMFWVAQPYSGAVGTMKLLSTNAVAASDDFAVPGSTKIIEFSVPLAPSGAVGKALVRPRVVIVFGF